MLPGTLLLDTFGHIWHVVEYTTERCYYTDDLMVKLSLGESGDVPPSGIFRFESEADVRQEQQRYLRSLGAPAEWAEAWT